MLRFMALPVCAVMAAGSAVAAGDEVERGRKFSQLHCARCHVVGDFNPGGGLSSAPSYQLMVNALDDYVTRFETFFKRPPHPAVVLLEGTTRSDKLPFGAHPITITKQQVADILTFARTLKKKKKK